MSKEHTYTDKQLKFLKDFLDGKYDEADTVPQEFIDDKMLRVATKVRKLNKLVAKAQKASDKAQKVVNEANLRKEQAIQLHVKLQKLELPAEFVPDRLCFSYIKF